MPGLFDIIEDVAADPAVDSSVEKLVGGLFSHLKELLSQGSAAAIDQVLNDGIANTDKIVAAVTANTPGAPPATGQADPTTGGETEAGEPASQSRDAAGRYQSSEAEGQQQGEEHTEGSAA